MTILLRTPEVALRLGLAQVTLRKWRLSGIGPRFVRCGRNVRYDAAEVDAWVAARTVNSTSQQPAS